jgi:glycosyltransferase involved in cell wall biosynthesis
MKNKILILSLGRKGGCVTYGTQIINNFNFDYELYVSNYCIEEIPLNSIKIRTYQNKIEFIFSTFFRMPIWLIKIFIGVVKNKYKAIYLPYFHFWNIFPILIFKIFQRPIIITVHDGIMHYGDGEILEQTLNKICIKLADKIIFLTSYVQNLTKKKIGFKASSFVIPHGLILPNNIMPRKRKHPKGILKILFFGRINKYKGIELLLEAFQLLSKPQDYYLTIAGKSSYNINWPQLRNLSVIDKFLEEEEISYLLNTSDILILPYIEATQSGVVTLGMASGLPIICTDVGGLKEQIGYENALFCSISSSDLKSKIELLHDDCAIYETLSDRILAKGESLSWSKIAMQIQELIEESTLKSR